MSDHTLPITKPDQNVCDSVNDWHWRAEMYVAQYIKSYVSKCSELGKKLIVIDLFSGSGYVKWKNTLCLSSSFGSVNQGAVIEQWIFLEADADKFEALEERVNRDHSDKNIVLLPSSANLQIESLKTLLEPFSDRNLFEVLCVSKPLNLDLQFNTVAELAKMQVDLLALHSLPEQAFRGPRNYINHNLERISDYLDMMEWAAILDQPQYNLESLTRLIADLFQTQMLRLGYAETDHRHTIKIGKKKPEFFLSYHSKNTWAQDAYDQASQLFESQTKLLV
jgi:three-Cys-motif partner protein